MLKVVLPVAGAIAIITIATFWLSTALSEAFASHETVTAVKSLIPWGFLILIPALAAGGGSGFIRSKGRRAGLVGAKAKADLAEAIDQGRLTVSDVDLAVDIVLGIWLQVTRSWLERGARPDLTGEALDAVLRALGAARSDARRKA